MGVAIYLFRLGRLFNPQAIALLSMVFAYLLGTIIRSVTQWLSRRRSQPATGSWGDLRALIVLGALLTAAVPELFLPELAIPPAVHRVALGLTLFYFGSR